MKKGSGRKCPRIPKSQLKILRKELKIEDLKAIVAHAKEAPLSSKECRQLEAAIDTLAFLTNELEAKGASIRRLRQMIFGSKTEKTAQVVGETEQASKPAEADGGDETAGPGDASEPAAGPRARSARATDAEAPRSTPEPRRSRSPMSRSSPATPARSAPKARSTCRRSRQCWFG